MAERTGKTWPRVCRGSERDVCEPGGCVEIRGRNSVRFVDGHRSDDYNIYIFVTTDYGENWKAIHNGLRIRPGACTWCANIRGIKICCLRGRVRTMDIVGPRREWTAF